MDDFVCPSCLCFFVSPQYLELDEDQNGMLSKRELMNFGESPDECGVPGVQYSTCDHSFCLATRPVRCGAQRSSMAVQSHGITCGNVNPPLHPPSSFTESRRGPDRLKTSTTTRA